MRNFPNVYCSFSPGMPVINGIPGSLVDMLKKVLTNGTDLFSFPEIKVLDGVATITGYITPTGKLDILTEPYIKRLGY